MLIDDSALAAQLKPALGDRVEVVARAFDDEVEGQVQALAQPDVDLRNGALSAYPSHAGAGGDRRRRGWHSSAARQGKVASHLAANLAVLPGLAQQIRLRNFPARSWWISPDCQLAGAWRSRPPCTPRWQRIRCVRGCSASRLSAWPKSSDRACIRRCMNCLRDRTRRGLAALRHIAAEVASPPHRMPALRASPAIVAALQGDAEALADLARRRGACLDICARIPTCRQRHGRSKRAMAEHGRAKPTCPICGKVPGGGAAAVLQSAVRRCRSGPLADGSVSDPGCARRCGGRLTSRAKLIGEQPADWRDAHCRRLAGRGGRARILRDASIIPPNATRSAACRPRENKAMKQAGTIAGQSDPAVACAAARRRIGYHAAPCPLRLASGCESGRLAGANRRAARRKPAAGHNQRGTSRIP